MQMQKDFQMVKEGSGGKNLQTPGKSWRGTVKKGSIRTAKRKYEDGKKHLSDAEKNF